MSPRVHREPQRHCSIVRVHHILGLPSLEHTQPGYPECLYSRPKSRRGSESQEASLFGSTENIVLIQRRFHPTFRKKPIFEVGDMSASRGSSSGQKDKDSKSRVKLGHNSRRPMGHATRPVCVTMVSSFQDFVVGDESALDVHHACLWCTFEGWGSPSAGAYEIRPLSAWLLYKFKRPSYVGHLGVCSSVLNFGPRFKACHIKPSTH